MSVDSEEVAPLRTLIWKVASRCNLDCGYCYVYKHTDQSWRGQPVRASLEVARKLGERIQEHADRHGLPHIDIVLHGGEALSVGVEYLGELCDALEQGAGRDVVRWKLQTNGVLLGDNELDFCLRRSIEIGLSMDGPRTANDLHRVDFAGASSFDAVEGALHRLSSEKGRRIWSGFLCVIDLRSDPLEVYRYLRSWRPKNIEFLLPLGHHDLRPPGKQGGPQDATPYADWLLPIYREWMDERPQPILIRRFRDVIALLAGAKNSSEEWGLQPVDFAVIETNGEIQAVDTLKVTFPGAANLGLDVFSNSLDDVYRSPAIRDRQERWKHLAPACEACPVKDVCGGGYIPHRYSDAGGFRNPSVYCSDLFKLIHAVHADVEGRLAANRVALRGGAR